MKKILKSVALVALTTPTIITTIACGSSTAPNQVNLGSITELTNLNLIVNTSKTWKELGKKIVQSTQFANLPLTKYDIAYFNQPSGGTAFDNSQNQVAGSYWIVIHARDDDPNWTGHTSDVNRLQITVQDNFRQIAGINTTAYTTTYDTTNNIIYVGTWTGLAGANGAVYQYDGAGNFVQLPAITGGVNCLLVANGTLYAGVVTNDTTNPFQGAVYKYDGVSQWSVVNGTTGIIKTLVATADGTIYAGTETQAFMGGVYQLVNGAFQLVNGTTGEIDNLATTSDGTIYAGARTGNNFQGALYQSDGTSDFAPVTGPQGWNYGLAVDNDDNLYVATKFSISASKIYQSDGNTFNEIAVPNDEVLDIAINPNDNRLYAGVDSGIITGYAARYNYELDSWTTLTGSTGRVWGFSFDELNKVIIVTDQGNNMGAAYISN